MTRDYQGRPIKTQHFSGSALPGPWGSNTNVTGSVTATYDVNDPTNNPACTGMLAAYSTDEASNTSTSCGDGLGRLKFLKQADGNAATYTYDVLDNLLSANFAGQWRRFEYDGLGRLTAACNPESVPDGSNGTAAVSCQYGPLPASGVDRYTYDNNSNLLTHKNARGVTLTASGYDGLNRPSGKTYSDSTPSVTYTYDQDVKGVLSSVSSGANGTVYQHDNFGRIVGNTQTTGGVTYPSLHYGYSLSDQLTSITYPSGRVVTYTLDALGRTSGVSGALQSANTSYLSNLAYTTPGGWSGMTLGNGVAPNYTWNDRVQLTGITAGNQLSLTYNYCPNGQATCAQSNNGNIWRETIATGGQVQAVQDYRYDSLNRLSVAAEKAGSSGLTTVDCTVTGSVWCQHYAYDTAGNMHVDVHYGDNGSGATTWDVTNFSATTNRIAQGSWHYDDTGNVTTDGTGDQLAYDAENRQTAFCVAERVRATTLLGRGRSCTNTTAQGSAWRRCTRMAHRWCLCTTRSGILRRSTRPQRLG